MVRSGISQSSQKTHHCNNTAILSVHRTLKTPDNKSATLCSLLDVQPSDCTSLSHAPCKQGVQQRSYGFNVKSSSSSIGRMQYWWHWHHSRWYHIDLPFLPLIHLPLSVSTQCQYVYWVYSQTCASITPGTGLIHQDTRAKERNVALPGGDLQVFYWVR